MTRTTAATTHASGSEASADALYYARAVLADVAHFDDATIAEACRTILSGGAAEDHREAARMLALVTGRAA